MTEAEWQHAKRPESVLALLRVLRLLPGKIPERKLRLLLCACLRRIWTLLTNDQRAVVEAIEADPEGDGAQQSRMDTAIANLGAEHGSDWHLETMGAVFRLVLAGLDPDEASRALGTICQAIKAYPFRWVSWFGWGKEPKAEAVLIREVFGNPFRPVNIHVAWLTSTVTSLAQAIYDERAFDRIPILADALEDAGCTNQDILNHCRGGGEHVRGCWVVDLLLGKE
jgi:hypothetical protein